MGFREIETGGGSWQLDRLGASGARLMVTLPLRLSAASATGVCPVGRGVILRGFGHAVAVG